MHSSELKKKAEALIEQLKAVVIENMPIKGNTSSECQRTGIIQSINQLESLIESCTDDDMMVDGCEVYRVHGRFFKITAKFPSNPSGDKLANNFMAENKGHSLLADTKEWLIITNDNFGFTL